MDFKSEYLRLSIKIHDYEEFNALTSVQDRYWEKAEYAFQNGEFEVAYNRVKSLCNHLQIPY